MCDGYYELCVTELGKDFKMFNHCLMHDVHKDMRVAHKVVCVAHKLFQKYWKRSPIKRKAMSRGKTL